MYAAIMIEKQIILKRSDLVTSFFTISIEVLGISVSCLGYICTLSDAVLTTALGEVTMLPEPD